MAKADFCDWGTSAFVILVSELLGRFIGERYIVSFPVWSNNEIVPKLCPIQFILFLRKKNGLTGRKG